MGLGHNYFQEVHSSISISTFKNFKCTPIVKLVTPQFEGHNKTNGGHNILFRYQNPKWRRKACSISTQNRPNGFQNRLKRLGLNFVSVEELALKRCLLV